MKLQVTSVLLCGALSASTLSAEDYICFTASVPANEPQTAFIADRELYMNKNGDLYSVEIVQGAQSSGLIRCNLQPFFGIGVSIKCGRESISLDLPNNAGTIKRDGNYALQNLVCRERTQLKL